MEVFNIPFACGMYTVHEHEHEMCDALILIPYLKPIYPFYITRTNIANTYPAEIRYGYGTRFEKEQFGNFALSQ